MSLKAELQTWAAALKAYDEEDFEKSLDLFSRIADSSKILTNMGLIYATLGEHEAAVEHFIEATNLDNYLAVAYFQCGVSNFLLNRYELALKDFEEALLYLRGNQAINYEQLGLKFRLFSAEVLFNKGLARLYLSPPNPNDPTEHPGIVDMRAASAEKQTDEHAVIDDAIRDRGDGYTVFSIPVGVLYRPSEKKLKNSTTKDYMGKAKLVAASDPGDAFTTFTGVTRLKQGISPSGVFIDDATSNLSRSATAPAPSLPKPVVEDRAPSLGRSKTTLNVPTNTRELTSGPVPSPSEEPSISRNNTTITPGRSSQNATIGGPVRGLSVRRPVAPAPIVNPPQAPSPPTKESDNRLTDIYDDYLDSYTDGPLQPAPVAANPPPDRVAAWARSNANTPLARPGTRSAPTSSYAPSSYAGGGGGGGSLRRKVTRRRAPSRIQSAYEEEEEGYASGDYDDMPFELIKIRVKLHYQDDVRGMALAPETSFEEFMDKVTSKFGKSINGLGFKFKDEDGGKVTLRDESDYDLAIETARESSKGKPEGKLEIWCTDI